MNIINFNDCLENNKAYGGMAGSKLGIIYQNEDWILKFPKGTKSMRNVDISYTTAPLSEYIGSQIYKVLGYDVHETKLGVRNGKLVVACKDFTKPDLQLQEFREIKNYYNQELEEILDHTITESKSGNSTSLAAVKIHLQYNPLLNKVMGIRERFWDCVVVDGLINNNDRNSGNWGILRKVNGDMIMAPIFDNGASFSTKLSDDQIQRLLTDENRLISSATNTVIRYNIDGKILYFKKLLNMQNVDLNRAILWVVLKIQTHWQDIEHVIREIPNEYQGIPVISEARKEFYIKGMAIRMEQQMNPALEKLQSQVLESVQSMSMHI